MLLLLLVELLLLLLLMMDLPLQSRLLPDYDGCCSEMSAAKKYIESEGRLSASKKHKGSTRKRHKAETPDLDPSPLPPSPN